MRAAARVMFVAVLIATSSAYACPMIPSGVTEQDVLNVEADMVAAQAVIVAIRPDTPLGPAPHGDFDVNFKLVKRFQGNVPPTFTVTYGGCHEFPGVVGDTIYVLAIKDKNGLWYAPQFWDWRDGTRHG